ncbi:trypsin-like peptidase domain-containing protein [Pseudooceanicola spongiae]|uniref:PDZ domain-containing protein n=1 Tax=Pseudooceanicola spongiae TaxID=2613965 RepID=A0A7L9WRE7_9RHOB|nr:trypsin-like peptidase domain-containing protein [Pseudooceanicola spongiae]QOL82869.1 PDZ domain-containing protein [Pseudooceanicola spongiae]
MTFSIPRSSVLASALVALLALGPGGPLAAETKVPSSQAEISMGFAPLVKTAAPAVVNIYAKRIVETRQSPFANDPIFSDFFKNFGQVRPQVQNSLGSGVILSDDGYVVSNFHVVGQADEIRVVLNDRREFNAKVLLADENSDLAILKLDGVKDLPHLDLRDSDSVEVGELVLAIGNPFGVGQTVSSGIVSGLARSGTATGSERGYFIQTDAPINPGNSGGALIDVNGSLIGVNTSILSRSGGSNGIGFAIPAALVRQFLDQSRAGSTHFERPWAGMSGHPVDLDMAEAAGLDRPEGMVIDSLHDESPFAIRGFVPGDIILAVDGKPISSPAEMLYRMTVKGLGGQADVTRLSGGKRADITVPMIAAPEEPARAALETGDQTAIPGMTLINVNPAVINEFQLQLDATGVMIQDPGRIGQRAGLKVGDVILTINGKDVTSPKVAEKALSNPGRSLELDLLRDGKQATMRFRL